MLQVTCYSVYQHMLQVTCFSVYQHMLQVTCYSVPEDVMHVISEEGGQERNEDRRGITEHWQAFTVYSLHFHFAHFVNVIIYHFGRITCALF